MVVKFCLLLLFFTYSFIGEPMAVKFNLLLFIPWLAGATTLMRITVAPAPLNPQTPNPLNHYNSNSLNPHWPIGLPVGRLRLMNHDNACVEAASSIMELLFLPLACQR